MFTWIFLLVLLTTVTVRFWLAHRQIRHIALNRQAVPTEFSEQISLQAHQKAADYTITKTKFGILSIGLDVAITIGLTLLGGLQWLDDLTQHYTASFQNSLVYGVCLIGIVGMVSSLIELPCAYYKQFVIEERFGFNRMTPWMFFKDGLVSSLVGIIIGAPLIAAVLFLMDAAGPYWWVWAWCLWSAFSLLLMIIVPTVIAPLFNKFTPMESGATRQRIENLLLRCGFASNGLFVMDGSKRSSHGNAYFTGMGKSKRIVFFDTLLERLTDSQIEAVLAHELGHFKKKHIRKTLILNFLASLFFLWVLSVLKNSPWFYEGLGVSPHLNSSNAALALVLFFLTLQYFTFLLKPLMSLLSRKHEFEADAYASEHSSGQELINALVKLYKDNASTLTPDPLYSKFYDSHPPASIRIAHLKALGAQSSTSLHTENA